MKKKTKIYAKNHLFTASESSSSESSSGSSSDSSSESDTDDEIDDAKLLLEVRKQMETTSKVGLKTVIPDHIKKEVVDSVTPSPDMKDALVIIVFSIS